MLAFCVRVRSHWFALGYVCARNSADACLCAWCGTGVGACHCVLCVWPWICECVRACLRWICLRLAKDHLRKLQVAVDNAKACWRELELAVNFLKRQEVRSCILRGCTSACLHACMQSHTNNQQCEDQMGISPEDGDAQKALLLCDRCGFGYAFRGSGQNESYYREASGALRAFARLCSRVALGLLCFEGMLVCVLS